jgi:hypothetical protein
LLYEDALVCRRCGNLISVCSDPNLDWHPNTTTCWPSASAEWGWRRLRKMHPLAEEVGDALHPLDGARVYSSQEQPLDDPFGSVAPNERDPADHEADDQ